MNRTQRAIKRQYREGEDVARNLKNRSITSMKNSSGAGLLNRKGEHAKQVRKYRVDEKEARNLTRDYKKRVLSEKLKEEAVGA